MRQLNNRRRWPDGNGKPQYLPFNKGAYPYLHLRGRLSRVRADRVRQAQPEGQDYSKPSERASWIARVRDVTASFR